MKLTSLIAAATVVALMSASTSGVSAMEREDCFGVYSTGSVVDGPFKDGARCYEYEWNEGSTDGFVPPAVAPAPVDPEAPAPETPVEPDPTDPVAVAIYTAQLSRVEAYVASRLLRPDSDGNFRDYTVTRDYTIGGKTIPAGTYGGNLTGRTVTFTYTGPAS